jgi:hypothetical protein
MKLVAAHCNHPVRACLVSPQKPVAPSLWRFQMPQINAKEM